MPARTRRRRRFRGGDTSSSNSSSSSSSNTRGLFGKLKSVFGNAGKNLEAVEENTQQLMKAVKNFGVASKGLLRIAQGTNDDNKKDAEKASRKVKSQVDEAQKNALKVRDALAAAGESIKAAASAAPGAASAAPVAAPVAASAEGGAKRRRCKSCKHRRRKTCNHHRRKSCKQHRRKSCKRRGRSCKGRRRR